jgi:putative ATP-dependent endonuclease of OLD family
MRLTKVRIENFRAHADTELPLSKFACLIGENNAGKSTVLHALQFALEGNRLALDDFRDAQRPVRVTIWLEGIGERDLARIVNEEHRGRVEKILRDGALVLVRSMPTEGTSDLEYMGIEPNDPRWSLDLLNAAMGRRAGPSLRAAAIQALPELDAVLEGKPSTALIREKRVELVEALPEDQLRLIPTKLPTGIPAAVKPLLPEVIYIEAVKDATSETKNTDSTTFGKLLKLLLGEVASDFEDISASFVKIQRKLSRVTDEDGTVKDDRLDQVRLIESTIESFVRESFPDVRLNMDVPAPTLPTILGAAQLRVNDGHEGPLANKGDGLKRTVLFAILRAYTRLRSQGLNSESAAAAPASSYVLLFEEPELYLHPRAQRQLMSTLTDFSVNHPVLVTTHSPSFFGRSTTGFAKLQKNQGGVHVFPVDLDISKRDSYQLVQYENNEAAFFARSVVLVEGDSDTFTFPHLARLIDPAWDDDELNVMFIKTGGKGSITRYRKFFKAFGVQVHVITDLDALVDGFTHLTTTQSLREQHAKLMSKVNRSMTDITTPNSEKVKQIVEKRRAKEVWLRAQGELDDWSMAPSGAGADQIRTTLDELFAFGRRASNLTVLKDRNSSLTAERDALLDGLMEEEVHVLRRGDLESYCGGNQAGAEKVTRAMLFCQETTTLEAFRARHGDEADSVVDDLTRMFSRIYASPPPAETGTSD